MDIGEILVCFPKKKQKTIELTEIRDCWLQGDENVRKALSKTGSTKFCQG